MPVSRSPRRYLERKGAIRTSRLPRPTLNLSSLRVLDEPTPPPYPEPYRRLDQAGVPAPDRGATRDWPPTE